MDYQLLFNIALGLAAAMGGWILKSIAKSIDRLDTDVRSMSLNYVTKNDWKDAMREMKEEMHAGFDRIELNLNNVFKKLDRKEDKV